MRIAVRDIEMLGAVFSWTGAEDLNEKKKVR
jgi:hypothetical protein